MPFGLWGSLLKFMSLYVNESYKDGESNDAPTC